jgi:hypothetical protein
MSNKMKMGSETLAEKGKQERGEQQKAAASGT